MNNYTPGHKLLNLDTSGAQESIITFYTGNNESGSECPAMLVQQQDGKVIAATGSKMYRFDSDINPGSSETRSCSNFSQVNDKTPAAIQSDDKIVVAGRYSGGGNLILVRILTN